MKSKQPVWISVRAAPMRTASTHRRPMSVCWQRLYRGMLPGSHNGIRLKAAGIMWNSCVKRYRRERLPLATYMAGSAGPKEADELLQRHHHTWSHADV